MVESYTVVIITYNHEACNPPKGEVKGINRIQDHITTRIITVPIAKPNSHPKRETVYMKNNLHYINTNVIIKNPLKKL